MMYNQYILHTLNKFRSNIHVHIDEEIRIVSPLPAHLPCFHSITATKHACMKSKSTSHHNHVHLNVEINPSSFFKQSNIRLIYISLIFIFKTKPQTMTLHACEVLACDVKLDWDWS